MKGNVYLYILVMAGVTYLIRMLPLTLLRKEIRNVYVKSFLYYVPYVTLAVMTFPAVLSASGNTWAAAAGFLAAVICAYRGASLFKVSVAACVTVLVISYLPF